MQIIICISNTYISFDTLYHIIYLHFFKISEQNIGARKNTICHQLTTQLLRTLHKINISIENFFVSKNQMKYARICKYVLLVPRTTDAQRGNSLHCTAENSLPLPNF